MSYGTWSKWGKGWASIEIDTPGGLLGHAELQEYHNDSKSEDKLGSYYFLIKGMDKHGVEYHEASDVNHLKWELNQVRRHPYRKRITYTPGNGEHQRWVAFDNTDALNLAITEKYDRENLSNDREYGKLIDWKEEVNINVD